MQRMNAGAHAARLSRCASCDASNGWQCADRHGKSSRFYRRHAQYKQIAIFRNKTCHHRLFRPTSKPAHTARWHGFRWRGSVQACSTSTRIARPRIAAIFEAYAVQRLKNAPGSDIPATTGPGYCRAPPRDAPTGHPARLRAQTGMSGERYVKQGQARPDRTFF